MVGGVPSRPSHYVARDDIVSYKKDINTRMILQNI